MYQLLKGKPVSDHIFAKVKAEVDALLAARHSAPALAVLRFGTRADDVSYESSLTKALGKIGMTVQCVVLPKDAPREEVAGALTRLSADPAVDGILPLLPLPADCGDLLPRLAPAKDVDGLLQEKSCYTPCTPRAVMELLDFYRIPVAQRKAVVFGRSPQLGRPLAALLKNRGAEIAVIHSKTPDPEKISREGELIFSAVGKPRFLTADYLKPGQIVVDIGINPDPLAPGKLCGDLDEVAAKELSLTYTPVPGGIGAITTAVLAEQLLHAAAERRNLCAEI